MADDTEISTDHTSIDVEDILLKPLKESMKTKLGPAVSPLPSKCCIFKVPQVLRRHNPKAYQPDVVSIGPYHRHRKQLQRMETVKRWYFRNLLTRMKISPEEFIQRINDETENGIVEFEERARSYYAEPLDHPKKKEFMEIMILDGCFVIQLFWKKVKENKEHNEEKKDDPILNMDCMFQYICHDLLLLENQLPWIVLSCLYRVIFGGDSQFSDLLLEAFCSLNSLKEYFISYVNSSDRDEDRVLHILDLVRTFIVFKFKTEEEKKIGGREIREKKFNEDQVLHRLDLIRTFIVSKFQPSSRNNKKWLCCFGGKEEEKIGPEIPAATALSEAGVKFERSSDDNLMNIGFKKGVLTIPELAVAELTEPLFRNLIAFEQCYHGHSHKITSYAYFMDKLINSDKDIELLCDKKILANWLNVQDGSKFFNSLYIDTRVIDFQYEELCVEVNKYYRVKWNKDLEEFKRNHCRSPWKAIALAVAIFILILQILQFIFRFVLN